MVIYFSATGNTEFVAKEIAKRLDDECVNILDRVRNNDYSGFHSEKPFIICAPIYVCEIPRFMAAYLKKITFSGSKDVYCIFTSGGYCGIAGNLMKWMFRNKKMKYHGHAEFKMPRNYVANDHYPMLEKEEIEKRIIDSYNRVDDVVGKIKEGNRLKARHVWLWEIIVTLPFNPVWCKIKLTTKDFYTNDKCVNCGKCESLCPLNNVKIIEGKTIWENNCTHCMACIGNCPTKAIEYGTITKEKSPYNFGEYQYVIENISTEKNT